MAYKKTFVAGDKLLASELTDNFTELEPTDLYEAPVPAFLTCGTAGDLTDFQSVSDGGFKISIDGTERDITGLDLTGTEETIEEFLTIVNSTGIIGGGETNKYFSQPFTTGADVDNIKKISLGLSKSSTLTGTGTVSIRADDGSGDPTGSDIESKTASININNLAVGTAGWHTFEFAEAVTLSPNTTYHIVFRTNFPSGQVVLYGDGNGTGARESIDSGVTWTDDSGEKTGFKAITIVGKSIEEIRTIIQTAIRTATGSLETVEYVGDHFVISSVNETATSAITILSAPTTGTDISGATYLNGSTNGVVTDFNNGSIAKVVKTGDDGKVDKDLLNGVQVFEEKSAGYLTGGSNPSALSVFDTLMQGNNDGAFKANIDGNEYEVPIALEKLGTASTVINNEPGGVNYDGISNTERLGQSFTVPVGMKTLTAITLYERGGDDISNATMSVYDSVSKTTLLGSKTQLGNGNSYNTWTFDSAIDLSAYEGEVLFFELTHTDATDPFYAQKDTVNTNYTGGSGYLTGNIQSYDWWFRIAGQQLGNYSSYAEIATEIQTALQAVTGGSELVTYDTDHFLITSGTVGITSKVLQLTSPTTGTDISGAGATPYLDMASNAVETQGENGSYEDVVKTSASTGKIDKSLIGANYFQTGLDKNPDGNETTTIICGFRISEITVKTNMNDGTRDYLSFGGVDASGNNACVWTSYFNEGVESAYCGYNYLNSSNYCYVAINNITDTGFDLVLTQKGLQHTMIFIQAR